MATEARRHPIDPEALEEGSVIFASEIESWCGHPVGSDKHRLRTLAIIETANDHFSATGKPLLAKTSRGNVVVVAGNAMVDTGETRMERAFGSIGRTVEFMSRVDRAALDNDHTTVLDRTLYVGTRLIDGARLFKREAAKAVPYKRELPSPAWVDGQP